MSNCWSEIEHVEGGGALEMMKLEDGNFVVLSVAVGTVKVFATPALESPETFAELASFPLEGAVARLAAPPQHRKPENESILIRLRKAVGWPKSIDELRQTLDSMDTLGE